MKKVAAIVACLAVALTLTGCGGASGKWYCGDGAIDYMTLDDGGSVGGFVETWMDGTVGAATSDAKWEIKDDDVRIEYTTDSGQRLAEHFTYGKDSSGNEVLKNSDSGVRYYRTKALAIE